jgi:lipopolysaccharide/colanic/teichoic acid biosynthesis glycosyltransferase
MSAQRFFDIFVAIAGLLVLAPLLLLVALLVRLTSPGPVFHRSERVGQGGRLFWLYKFRSMVAQAERLGPGITGADDRRITPFGRWLRRLKLDELPQLLNVLRGDMSLVGPRPEDPRYVALYTPEQRRLLAVRPGLTSAASVRYRHEEALLQGPDWEETYRTVVLPDKLHLDLAYLERRTFFSDVRLILETCLAVLRL